ncbi:hypothetical protein [Thermodesulfitimonas sp.]
MLLSNPTDQGAVNSTVELAAEIPPQGKEVLFFLVVAGRNFHEIWEKNALVLNEGPGTLLRRTAIYWENWVRKAVKTGILTELYSEELGRFIRGLYPAAGAKATPDYTLDASLWGVWGFGVLPATDPRVVRTMEAVRDGLWVKTEVDGVAQYANDYYFRRSDDVARVPGNPWFICTLWLADWYVARAQSREGLAAARELIEWAVRYSLPTGIMVRARPLKFWLAFPWHLRYT